MKALNPADLDRFARQYRWAGSQLRRVNLRHRRGQLDIDIVLGLRTAIRDLGTDSKTVRLHLRFVDVAECRFQKRLAQALDRVADVKFGFFDGYFYANLDSWSLAPGERPAVHDFRGSEAYIGAKDLLWQELPRREA